MLKNRPFSFIILFFIYAIATYGGFVLYNHLSFDYRFALLISDIFATLIVFIFSLTFENASVYDPYWSVQPLVILTFYAISRGIDIFGLLLLITIGLWGIRLTANWAYTFENLTSQDWRYTMLHEKTGKLYPLINLIGIHLVPTIIVYLCVLPAVVVIYEWIPFCKVSIIFLLFSILATTIQLIADIQMQSFRKEKKNGTISGEQAIFIRKGLWKHGRHPNYFGEILMWWGIGLACVFAMPQNWYLLAGATANTILFFCVSIPLADGKQSKKPGFAEYKKQTRILI